jgi:hypothetical protein
MSFIRPKETVTILRSTHLNFSAFLNQIAQTRGFLDGKFICLEFEANAQTRRFGDLPYSSFGSLELNFILIIVI